MNISGGGGATSPGGSNTQVQYNSAGAFAGDAGLTFDSATGKLTIGKQLSISSGAVTTSAPLLDLAQTWNAGAVTFTGVKLNVTDTASAAASNLLDLQVGGVSKFAVSKAGALTIPSTTSLTSTQAQFPLGSVVAGNSPGISFLTATNMGLGANASNLAVWAGGIIAQNYNATNLESRLASDWLFSWSSATNNNATADLVVRRDTANTLAQRNGTSAQMFRVYGTSDASATNYERAKIGWVGSTFYVGTEQGGTGTARAMEFQTGGLTCLTINSSGNFVFADAKNIAVGTGTGTKIASAST
ncbi:MAG: hypothetical protein EBT79_14375, partial [Actinobacteria bacterium]|nr:hypothetical protein [Actinomycetota bacterium]